MTSLRVAVASALILAATAAPAAAADTVFVELAGAPSADGTSEATLDAERSDFRARAKKAGISYHQHFAYRTLFNGVSISTDDQDAIADLDGVAAVYPVQTAHLDQQRTEAFDPDLAYAITMTGVDIAHSKLGYTGRGVRVAIMDSGVDYDHPDLGGCFGHGCRVSTGYDFVGDDYDGDETDPGYQPIPHPDPDPDDCFGHGTHVAGIVGANGGVTGVAPDVTLGSYRVFGCNGGGTSADVMLAAMERIYRDGADVLNMSITEDLSGWPQSPTAQAAARLVRKGVVVVAGAGNDRTDGLWAMGAPAVGDGVIAVASVDNLKQAVRGFSLSPDDRPVQTFFATDSKPVPAEGTFEIAGAGDACEPLAPGSLDGKVALVRRGTCTFMVKGNNAAAAGAVAVVFYNNAPGVIPGNPVVTGVPIPAVAISGENGDLITGRLAQGPVRITWGMPLLPSATAGLVSYFSSDGLAADLTLKPDIAAPGGSIRSTWPVEKGSYAVVSGTSMASPHVAGAAALYLQAHPRTRSRDVGAILENSADPVLWSGAPGLGYLDYVARQGAGLLDADDAILATGAVTPGTLSLGDDQPAPRTLTVSNESARTITYTISNADALAVGGREFNGEHPELGANAVTFTQPQVAVRPHGHARIGVTIAPAATLSEGAIYGGYLVFTPDDGGPPLRVPYAGYKGDYQAVPAMTPTAKGYPMLARQADTDVPTVLVHMNNYARRIRIVAYDARRHRRIATVLRRDYVSRNHVEAALTWNVATALTPRRLPPGQYYLVMTVERALAQRGTPVETWTSPEFTIARR
jgi:minor extracellular serine protease Vpr